MTRSRQVLSSMKEIEDLSGIKEAMIQVFQDAQMNLSSHKKLVIVMRNIHLRAIEINLQGAYNLYFSKLINMVLKLKKGEKSADRIAKFCSVFVSTILREEKAQREKDGKNDEDDEEDSPASDFVEFFIRHLLRGTESKDKNVRYRVVQLLAYLVNYITELDEELFQALHFSLRRRLYDKEANVRIQAIVAISRFQFFELDENTDQLNSATKSLLQALENDDSAEVRRAALLNLVKDGNTLPYLLDRARDNNAINRRLVYSRILKEIKDYREIDIDLREQLLNWGLNDRDESVKHAVVNMITHNWSEVINDDLLELIESLKVIDSDIAEDVMVNYFEARNDKVSSIKIAESDWKELSIEKIFLIRTFFQYCKKHQLYELIDNNFPELSELAKNLEKYLKLRTSFIEPQQELINSYQARTTKLEKLNELITKDNSQILDLSKKIAEEEYNVAHFVRLRNEIDSKILDVRRHSQTLTKKLKSSRSSELSEEILKCKNDIEQLETSSQQYCKAIRRYETLLEKHQQKLEEVEKVIPHHLKERKKFVESTREIEEEYQPFKESLRELEFVIEQLMIIINEYDFDDVVGNRRMLPIIRNYLTYGELPQNLIKVATNILRKTSANENDFSSLCVEVITDIRDAGLEENDETFLSAVSMFRNTDDEDDEEENTGQEGKIILNEVDEQSNVQDNDTTNSNEVENEKEKHQEKEENDDDSQPSKKRKLAPKQAPDEVLNQCLMILQNYLELIEHTLSNMHQIESLVETLVYPAIYNQTRSIKLLGYRCLGLYSLIDRQTAKSNLKFFGMSASKAGQEDLKVLSIRIVFDILSTHGISILDDENDQDSVDSLSLARLFYSLLKKHEMPSLQATVAEGLCKLFLADLLTDFGKGQISNEEDESSDSTNENKQETQLLEALVLSYFHPLNHSNHELKQTLAFCLPVYAFSHPNHQAKLVEISGDCLYRIFRNDGVEVLQTPTKVINQLINWCDPNNVVNQDESSVRKSPSHFLQAIKFLQVLEQDSPKEVKKSILTNLSKLFITEELGSVVLQGLNTAIQDTKNLVSERQDDPNLVLDVTSERNLEKFHQSVKSLILKAQELESTRKESAKVEEQEKEQETTSITNKETEVSEIKEENSPSPPATPPHAQDLDEIDQMLEEEANVDYEIDRGEKEEEQEVGPGDINDGENDESEISEEE